MIVRRILVAFIVVLIAAVALAYVARRPLLTAVGSFLIEEDTARPADAIVVLSGSVPDRMLEAVDLYRAQLASRIVLTREPVLPGLAVLRERGGNVPEHHEDNLAIAQQLGIPAAAVAVLPTPVSSTIAEAQLVVGYLRAQGLRSVLLVTSKAHARRAGMIFRHLAGPTYEVAVCPSPYDPFTAEGWWSERAYVRRVVIEYGKLLNYLLIDRWRTGRYPAGAA